MYWGTTAMQDFNPKQQPCERGEIAWFVKLHYDTLDERRDMKAKESSATVFTIEGKERPWLVIAVREVPGKERLYEAVPCTTQSKDSLGNKRPGHVSLGTMMDPHKVTFVDCWEPRYLPERFRTKRREAAVRIDKLGFDCLRKIISHHMQQMS